MAKWLNLDLSTGPSNIQAPDGKKWLVYGAETLVDYLNQLETDKDKLAEILVSALPHINQSYLVNSYTDYGREAKKLEDEAHQLLARIKGQK